MVLEVRYRNAGQFLVSYCTNLSRGGLFVSTAEPAAVGETITLALRVPGRSAPARIRSTVRWVRAHADESGPAGMGVSFDDVDVVLGDHIDRLVTHAAKLRIDIAGTAEHATTHLDALVRSLLTCETRRLSLDGWADGLLDRTDLLIVDVDGNPDLALALLARVAGTGTPTLALCSARNLPRRRAAGVYARVVPTPIDSEELQTCVLETLGSVRAESS
jgi:uncharacterized protein (TIGR02266 family)